MWGGMFFSASSLIKIWEYFTSFECLPENFTFQPKIKFKVYKNLSPRNNTRILKNSFDWASEYLRRLRLTSNQKIGNRKPIARTIKTAIILRAVWLSTAAGGLFRILLKTWRSFVCFRYYLFVMWYRFSISGAHIFWAGGNRHLPPGQISAAHQAVQK